MITMHFFLLIMAAILFFFAAFHVEHERVSFLRVSFLPLGLFCWVVAIILAGR